MAGPSWTQQGSTPSPAATGPSWARKKPKEELAYPAPPSGEGYSVVKDFGDGSYLMDASGTKVFVDQISGVAQTDPLKIAEILGERGAEGSTGRQRAGEISRGELAQEIVGEGSTRIFSAAKGVPFFRELVEPLAAFTRTVATDTPFERNLENVKAATSRREQEAPTASALSRLATGLGISAPFAIKQKAQSRLGKMAEGGFVGGVGGGAEGLISGFAEGYFDDPSQSFTDRLRAGYDEATQQGASGAKIGGGIGSAAPLVGEGAGFLYGEYLKKPVRDIVESIGFKDDAARIVEDTLAMDAARAVESAKNTGPYGSISTLGPNTQALLDVVANSPSRGAAIAQENLKDTAVKASSDLVSALDNELGAPTQGILTQKAKIMEDTAKARRSLYDKAYDFEVRPDTDGGAKVIDLFDRVTDEDKAGARKLLREAGEPSSFVGGQKITQEELQFLPAAQRQGLDIVSNPDGTYTASRVPTVASLDYITRQLYDQAQSLRQAGNAEAAASKRNLAIQIRTSLDEVNPDYAAARAAGKDAIDQKLAADLGNDILRPTVSRENVALGLQSIDEVGRNQLRQALRNRIDEISANAKVNPRADNEQEVVEALAALKAMNNRAVATKLEMALGKEQAQRIGQQINDTSSALMQHASVALGSKTAIRQLVSQRMREMVGTSLGEKVSSQGLLSTVTGAAVDAAVGGPSQADRIRAVSGEIAPVLTQRKTTKQLQAEARKMEDMTRILDAANRGRQGVSDLTRGAGMGLTTQQTSQGPESEAERRLRMMGIGTYGR